MKKVIYALLLVVLVLIIPSKSVAQTNSDTLVVNSIPTTDANALDVVVAADQASSKPHKVYKLTNTTTPYVFNASVVVDNSVSFVGVLGTNGRPPCIQPNVLADGSIPGHLFTFTKANSVVKLKNLYLLGISINNSINSGDGFGVTVTGDGIKCYIDNVVFEQWSQFGINYSGIKNSFWITNCKFRNFVNPGSGYTGEALRFRNDLNKANQDTIVMKYNTFLGVNGYVAAVGITGYLAVFDFQHNTVVGTFKNPFFNMNITNWTVSHNIFYAAWSGGMSNGEYPWWDRIWTGGLGSIIDLDSLNAPIAKQFDPQDSAKFNGTSWNTNRWLAEAKRKITITDNVYFRPASITAAVAAWNTGKTPTIPDPANPGQTMINPDYIYECPWMNDLTKSMFANKAKWPLLTESGNQNIDLGFGTGIAAMIGASGTTVPAGMGIGLIPWLQEMRGNGGVATHFWGYQMAKPDYTSGNWVPTWPLPEQTANDLKYTSSAKATDGIVYGDPFWTKLAITDVQLTNQLPTTFALENNYPNPFNPTTTIRFTVPQSGYVNLKVYDIMGREVRSVVDNAFKAQGNYEFKVDMNNLASGVYYYRLEQGAQSITKKMMLLK